ncbi:MAG: biotin--[Clostridia bacterium]|nr:biotin--[acetyl-CoA-carboxylase] ligase [Clostridia bacterium]
MNKEYIERELIYKLPKIDLYECVNSTNTLMKELAKEGGQEFCVIIAEQQSGGRGRLGRTFHSPKGSGVYMSILLRPNERLNPLYITTYAAVCCARAFEKLTDKKAYIKWVNDIYVDSKKVCGILTESSLGENGYAILGIGVNVTVPEEGFPEDIKLRAGALFEEEKEHMRERVIALILNEFITAYTKCEKGEMLQEYRQKSLVTGKRIDIIENGMVERADAIRIDDEFALIVKKDDGKLYTLNSGDVSIVI